MKNIHISIISFWDTPHDIDYMGVSDVKHTIYMFSDGEFHCKEDGVEVEPKGKIWDELFKWFSKVKNYTPNVEIKSGGANISNYEIVA